MNNKSSKTLYISFLPILILVGVIVGAGYFLTEGELKLPGDSDKLNVRRLENYPREVLTTKVLDKQRLVIDNQKDLDTFLASIDSSNKPLEIVEKINFDKELVLVSSTSTQETDGYKMKIDKIYIDEEANSLLASIELTEPGDSCIDELEQATNVWVDIVTIKKTDKEIEFERLKNVVECN